MIKVLNNELNENAGYFKIKLDNDDKILLTRIEYGNLKDTFNHDHLMFESTSGNFYKPVAIEGDIYFKIA